VDDLFSALLYPFNSIRMSIIIGGSGSTGSSLFAQLLNRHSKIYCGPETALFTKLELYKDWEKHKKKIPGKGLMNGSWHRWNGIELPEQEFLWKDSDINTLAAHSSDLESFSKELFSRVLKSKNKSIWAEKTPSNAIAFQYLGRTFKEVHLIHCVRNPYDTISSLMNRGFNAYYATALYLINTAAGLSARHMDMYHEVQYEALVTDSKNTLNKVMESLGLSFEERMLEASEEETKIETWAFSESGNINMGSVGRFEKDHIGKREQIMDAAASVVISDSFCHAHQLSFSNMKQVCEQLNYSYFDGKPKYRQVLKRQRFVEKWNRWSRGYPYNFSNYPIQIVS